MFFVPYGLLAPRTLLGIVAEYSLVWVLRPKMLQTKHVEEAGIWVPNHIVVTQQATDVPNTLIKAGIQGAQVDRGNANRSPLARRFRQW